jgi:hypothetical protein
VRHPSRFQGGVLFCEVCGALSRCLPLSLRQVTIDDTPCAVWGSDYSEHYAIWIDSNADSGNDPTTATVRWGRGVGVACYAECVTGSGSTLPVTWPAT